MNMNVDPLQQAVIIMAICQAWRQSQPEDPSARHEEGGYIAASPDGSFGVRRWPRGRQSHIVPPPLDGNNCYNGAKVVATFHTHPNPPIDELGREWEQGPSESDRRWHGRRK